MAKKLQYAVVVDRATWMRGGLKFITKEGKELALAEGESVEDEACEADGLMREGASGMMCCLGFAANQLAGVGMRTMTGAGMPGDLAVAPDSRLHKKLLAVDLVDEGGDNTNFSAAAATLNDNTHNQDVKNKEYELKKLFAANNIKLTFTGKSPKGVIVTK